MNALKLRFLLLCTLILSVNAYCENFPVSNTEEFLQHLAEKNPGFTFKFILPINVYDKNIVLNISIPQDLKFEHEYPGNPHFMQYGDKNALITISHQTGGKFQANQSIDRIIKSMEANSQVTILQNKDEICSGYIDSYRIVKSYDAKKNTNDIIYIYAISGPFDSATVLYSMKLYNEDQVNTLVQKVKNSFNANIKVIIKDFGV